MFLAPAPVPLPDRIAQAIWRGNALGGQAASVLSTGHAALDAELPGGGWPCQSLTEILQAPQAHAEWRLLAPGLARLVAQGGTVLLVGPPHCPHLPALRREGLREDRLIWVDVSVPAERLWATEQALKARSVSAVLAWLPQVRAGVRGTSPWLGFCVPAPEHPDRSLGGAAACSGEFGRPYPQAPAAFAGADRQAARAHTRPHHRVAPLA